MAEHDIYASRWLSMLPTLLNIPPRGLNVESTYTVVTQHQHSTVSTTGLQTNHKEELHRTLHHQQDPYRLYPTQTLLHLQIFFDHVNSILVPLYPRQQFQRWVEETSDKTEEELSLLYAVLALASTYNATTFESFGDACAAVARAYATKMSTQACLISSHLLLYLALYDSVTLEYHLASGSVRSAVRRIASLGYHRELICITFGNTSCADSPFGFTREQTNECKRRTFWAGFVLDRLSSWAFQTRNCIEISHIDVRVPADEGTYAAGCSSRAPFYDNGFVEFRPTPRKPVSEVGILAWLILITTVFGRAIEYRQLSETLSYEHPPALHASWFAWMKNSLEHWADTLPAHFQDTKHNLQESRNWEQRGAFIMMHSLRFLATIFIHSCFKRLPPPQGTDSHIEMAARYAHQYLKLCVDAGGSRVPFDWMRTERSRGCLLFSPATMILHLTEHIRELDDDEKIRVVLSVSAGTI